MRNGATKIEAFHTENSVNTHWKQPPIPFGCRKCSNTYAMRMVEYGIQYIQESFASTYLLVRFCSDDFNTIESKPISDGYSSDNKSNQRLCTCSIEMKWERMKGKKKHYSACHEYTTSIRKRGADWINGSRAKIAAAAATAATAPVATTIAKTKANSTKNL